MVNDVARVVRSFRLLMFADDLKIFAPIFSTADIQGWKHFLQCIEVRCLSMTYNTDSRLTVNIIIIKWGPRISERFE